MKTVDAKAGLLRDNGNLEESEKLYEKVVDGMRSCQGFNHLVAGHENEQQFDIGSSHTVSSRVCVRVEKLRQRWFAMGDVRSCGAAQASFDLRGRRLQSHSLFFGSVSFGMQPSRFMISY